MDWISFGLQDMLSVLCSCMLVVTSSELNLLTKIIAEGTVTQKYRQIQYLMFFSS